MSKFFFGSIVLLVLALTVAAVSSSRGNTRTRASLQKSGKRFSAVSSPRAASGFAAPDHFLSGRAELPQ
jgi:hypothetical protein